ncbi:MAG: hypothetical protein FD189_2365 [Elusimicrobia bacterium]|nr:MAG: hypothetical protein FD154_1480 [Elusimicrobiota bacterium]KAF0153664.1 MAG: hypothetical protein FD189_2365 [Elusimicrobiota bacterium]
MKIVILGNSGSGKTRLAAEIAKIRDIPVVHLDELFWEPGGFDRARPRDAVLRLVEESRKKSDWIVEGVFGDLAELYMEQADLLLWLDIGWDVCKERLLARGLESRKHMSREQSEEGLAKLLDWASHYYDRTDPRSFAGHLLLFERFHGKKMRIGSEEELAAAYAAVKQGYKSGGARSVA